MTAVIISKTSRFEKCLQSANEEVITFLKSDDPLAKKLREADDSTFRTLDKTIKLAERYFSKVEVISLENIADKKIPRYTVAVLANGGDGTFLGGAKYLPIGIPIVSIVANPAHSVGHYSHANPYNIENILQNFDNEPISILQRHNLVIDGAVLPTPFLNDVAIKHEDGYTKIAIHINSDGEAFTPRGSGVIIASKYGSTGVISQEGGEIMPLSCDKLQFTSRTNKHEGAHYGSSISAMSPIDDAVLCVDGGHDQYLLPAQAMLEIKKGPSLTLVGDINKLRADYLSKYNLD